MFANTKKFVVAGVAAISVAGAALAFANTLSVTSNNLGSGTGSVASPACAPAVSYETTWNVTAKTFDVTKVTAATAAACDGKTIQAALVGTGTSLWSSGAGVTIAAGSTSWTIAPGTVNAAAVTDAYATVTG